MPQIWSICLSIVPSSGDYPHLRGAPDLAVCTGWQAPDMGVQDRARRDQTDMWVITSTVIRAHPCAAGALKKDGGQDAQALGRSRGGFSTKIHVNVDALGNPLRFKLTGGQRHDITQADALIAGYEGEFVIADKSYDADDFRQTIRDCGAVPVIPPRSNRKELCDYDKHLYKERHLVECFIGKIKHYRRILSRFEKLAKRYLGFLSFVGALIWLR